MKGPYILGVIAKCRGVQDARVKNIKGVYKINNSGSEEVNSMKMLLYGEQSQGYDGN